MSADSSGLATEPSDGMSGSRGSPSPGGRGSRLPEGSPAGPSTPGPGTDGRSPNAAGSTSPAGPKGVGATLNRVLAQPAEGEAPKPARTAEAADTTLSAEVPAAADVLTALPTATVPPNVSEVVTTPPQFMTTVAVAADTVDIVQPAETTLTGTAKDTVRN